MPDERHAPTQVEGIALVDWTPTRLMTDGVDTWTETWTGSAWVTGGATVRDFMMAPPASPDTLAPFNLTP